MEMGDATEFRPQPLKTLSEGRPRLDGTGIAFRIEMTDGSHADVSCETAELGDIMVYLASVIAAAAQHREPAQLEASETQNYLVPIPAQGIGFQLMDDPDHVLLVVRLHGVDLSFHLRTSGLTRLGSDIARIGQTLSARKGRMN
jgi:hypothetical protein